MIEIQRPDPWFDGALPQHIGLLLIRLHPQGLEVFAYLRPDASQVEEASFSEWVESRVARFVESGPEPDGWQARTIDEGWQLWARSYDPGELGTM